MAESAGKMYALATVLSLLAIMATILRFYARRMKQASLSWDDYMILPALVCWAMFEDSMHMLRTAELTLDQLFTIGTAVCMFVGKDEWFFSLSACVLTFEGTAIGNLGQHTGIEEDGMPVFDHRLRVFEQVNPVLPTCHRNAESVDR